MAMDKNLHAVILAGGSGTRFWPLSRQSRPKQFLNLIGKKSLLQETLRRIAPKVPRQNIWIVASRRYQREIRRQVAGFGLKSAQMLWEPKGKNTAPAIFWAAAKIHAKDPQSVMAVFPSDHLITNPVKFLQLLSKAVGLAQHDYLVTFGIVPTRPETGYGYLKTKKEKGVLRVEEFIEKPALTKARRFLKINRRDKFSRRLPMGSVGIPTERKRASEKTCPYMWNSGMFVWKTQTILAAFKRYLPSIYASQKEVIGGHGQRLKRWAGLPAISVDYGILEKAQNVAAVAAAGIGWSDVGSWEALAEFLPKDKKGNTARGNVVSIDCCNTLIFGKKRLVAAIGLADMLVIDTPDALLVCSKARSQEVKTIVDILRKCKRKGSHPPPP